MGVRRNLFREVENIWGGKNFKLMARESGTNVGAENKNITVKNVNILSRFTF